LLAIEPGKVFVSIAGTGYFMPGGVDGLHHLRVLLGDDPRNAPTGPQ
jgi:hypothetical protein